ncbi:MULTISPECIES: SMODS domain-containing nucleotidyltransferase [Paenibacillus]|uniref:Nucleotidyltransferase n=1 Tax=Paenibacillus borealis TaxID=160799 RepID=A0ABX3GUK8_PAEBO|nr:nucleotidyltransferase [Paenibacillus borealis]OMD37676.1 nucleotidyltransferase [Paenibacillus borealis]
MSVQSYLESLAYQLILRDSEKVKIDSSVSTIKSRVGAYFSGQLNDHFAFGSYTRGTMLPREADARSDVDYMVIFTNPNKYKPQTLLNHLKLFAEYYYSRSEIKQSHPTMVLELQHIKFELVPAQKDWFGDIYIPSPSSSYTEWMRTTPNTFNQKLTRKNTDNYNYIKPLVRLMKYWNRQNNNHFSSYELENCITDLSFIWCTGFKAYVYHTVESLSYNWNDSQDKQNRINRAKQIIKDTKYYESVGYSASAEQEIKKLFPEV